MAAIVPSRIRTSCIRPVTGSVALVLSVRTGAVRPVHPLRSVRYGRRTHVVDGIATGLGDAGCVKCTPSHVDPALVSGGVEPPVERNDHSTRLGESTNAMMECPDPDCSWRAIAPSENAARKTYLEHVVVEHTGEDAASTEWFETAPGRTSERRSHATEQVFIVFEGDLVLHTETTSIELSSSDSVRLEAGERYYRENPGEGPCYGIRVSAPRREFSIGDG